MLERYIRREHQVPYFIPLFLLWRGGTFTARVNEKESHATDDYEDALIVEVNHLVASVLCTFGSITKAGRGKNLL